MSKIQNPVQGWPAAIRVHGIWQLETQGYPRLQGYHCEEMTQRTPGSLFKCCDVSPKKTSYGLGWTRKHPNTQKRTWSKLIFLYCSTLLLNNPNIVFAFIFCSSTFTYKQYYVIEENGKMQMSSTLFYTLYICTLEPFIWVLLKR